MAGKNVLMYFAWSRPDEEGAPLGNLNNRFGALFEVRRLSWPKFEHLADTECINQGISGFLDNVLLKNYWLFREEVRIRTGNVVRLVERCTADGRVTLLDENCLKGIDILIIVSFDSQRTGQRPNETELTTVEEFLRDPGHTLFVCPHHDIGDVEGVPTEEVLAAQEMEFRHHGDFGIPGQQRFGGYGRALLQGLGVSVVNRFGLRPAAMQDGSAAPLQVNSAADRSNLLRGVKTFNLHPHLPHFEMLDDSAEKMDVLAQQLVDPAAPAHPFLGERSTFDALLQSKREVFGGRMLICDPTLWSSSAGALGSLRRFWANMTRLA